MPEREVVPKPIQKPHPRLWQTAGSPDSFFMAGELGVGVLGTTLLSPVGFMEGLLADYDRGLAACKKPVGKRINSEKGIFTFVHVAESRKQAIESGAAWSALWYVHAAPVIFKVPRRVWYDAIRAGLHPNSPRDTAALSGDDSTELDIAPDEIPVIALLKRMAKGEEISKEEAHEVTEELDSVIIGDPDVCRTKMKKYSSIGADRLMCLMQFGRIPHEAVMRSMRLTGEHLIPEFAEREAAVAL
jgi:alkanesulfonate monooxygenase SsuD/methylene tetrahydromethanopterin reductase-like flavin-dependent oxidoreductase (luciferase family)